MGGSSPDTSGQNEAAKINAQIAQDVWNNYKTTYMPMEKQYVADAQNYDTPEHREQAAQQASADVAQGYSNTQAANDRNMEGMGIRPDDAKFQAINARLQNQEAANQAGAQNMARRQVEQTGWDRRTGALSLGKGLPAQASNAAANAGSIYGNIANEQMNADQMGSNNIAGGVGAIYGIGHNMPNGSGGTGFWKDGGLVDRSKIKHLAMGGPAGPPGPAGLSQIMANQGRIPMPQAPQGNGVMGSAMQGAQTGMKIAKMFTGGTQAAAPVTDLSTLADGVQAAAPVIDATGAGADALATVGAEQAAAPIVEAGTAAAAGGADAAAAGGMAALGPLGWAGLAAMGIYALTRKADGGVIHSGGDAPANGIGGGKVSGPGTETSDSIPAMLSDGEYVVNADAVKHFGLDRLEKMNQVGLQKRYGIKR